MDNDEVDLWATDEVHFQQHGSRCRMWVPPETKDPVLLHHPTRRSVGYFGAVRLRDGKFRFSRETGKFNAMTFFAFLQMLRRTSIRSGRSVVVITDNARYHHARLHKKWRDDHRKDFMLDYLPPYSPELNPIERVWKLTRRTGLGSGCLRRRASSSPVAGPPARIRAHLHFHLPQLTGSGAGRHAHRRHARRPIRRNRPRWVLQQPQHDYTRELLSAVPELPRA